MEIREIRRRLTMIEGKKKFMQEQLLNLDGELVQLTARQIHIEEAQSFIQRVAQSTQEQLKFHIEDIVQMALDAVFPDEFEFRAIFEIKRNKTEARLVFIQNGVEIDPIDSTGGGAVDIASWGLRIAAWTLERSDNVMVLDEPFRFLDAERQPLAAEIMKQLSQKLGLQFIMVTHNPSIIDVADKVFTVKKVDGISKVS